MCRSIIVKGLESLICECVLGASRYGADENVFASLDETFPGLNWKKLADYMVGRVVVHGERRAREIEEVAETLRAIGIDPIMVAHHIQFAVGHAGRHRVRRRAGGIRLGLRVRREGQRGRHDPGRGAEAQDSARHDVPQLPCGSPNQKTISFPSGKIRVRRNPIELPFLAA